LRTMDWSCVKKAVVGFAVCAVLGTGSVFGANVGITTVGGTTFTTPYNRYAQSATMPENGEITSISIYHSPGVSGRSMILGIYDNSANSLPAARLAVTATTLVATTPANWQTINLTTPIKVAAGTKLWIAYMFQTAIPGTRTGTGGPVYAVAVPTATWGSDNMPATFCTNTPTTVTTSNFSIYATYTPLWDYGTSSIFTLNNVGIGTSTPNAVFNVQGGTILSGTAKDIILQAQSSGPGGSGWGSVTINPGYQWGMPTIYGNVILANSGGSVGIGTTDLTNYVFNVQGGSGNPGVAGKGITLKAQDGSAGAAGGSVTINGGEGGATGYPDIGNVRLATNGGGVGIGTTDLSGAIFNVQGGMMPALSGSAKKIILKAQNAGGIGGNGGDVVINGGNMGGPIGYYFNGNVILQNDGGNVGIGTSNPASGRLDVEDGGFGVAIYGNTSSGTGVSGQAFDGIGISGYAYGGTGVSGTSHHGSAVYGSSPYGYAGYFDQGKVYIGGNLGIGTTSPAANLDVNGTIQGSTITATTAMNVTNGDLTIANGKINVKSWTLEAPDYVFTKDYKLPSLKEVEKHIATEKHLPDVPSAAEMKKKGLDLVSMNMALLKKVEELTLYAIDQNKRIMALEKLIAK
jgi:hypothetical protein